MTIFTFLIVFPRILLKTVFEYANITTYNIPISKKNVRQRDDGKEIVLVERERERDKMREIEKDEKNKEKDGELDSPNVLATRH